MKKLISILLFSSLIIFSHASFAMQSNLNTSNPVDTNLIADANYEEVAIDTVPLPEFIRELLKSFSVTSITESYSESCNVAIGTWPTPEWRLRFGVV
ncbi:MAG: hypothetical protein ACC657_07160 [Thiohalomonadales bacterium]